MSIEIERDEAPLAHFYVEKQPWVADAACLGAATEMWFADLRTVEQLEAIDVCGCCTVRRECYEQAVVEEGSASAGRYGVRGGVTSGQRETLERRGGAWGRDPMKAARDISLDGVEWTRQHTHLARKLVAHLQTRRDGVLVIPGKVATVLECHTGSRLNQVFAELGAIGMLSLDEHRRWVYHQVPSSQLPPYLRGASSGEGVSRA